MLLGRQTERDALERLVADVCAGVGRVVVLRGEPGSGKTHLLDHLVSGADGCRVLRAAGVQPERALRFAALHQLLSPLLDQLDRLPGRRKETLDVAFGVRKGPTPNIFAVNLAILDLVAVVGADRPLLCVIDDAQWIDESSAQSLSFVARRLSANPIGIVLSTRASRESCAFATLPDINLDGLERHDARRLLEAALPGPHDERVRERVIAETHGNPLALLELARRVHQVELGGGYGPVAPPALRGQLEEAFQRDLALLDPETRQLMLIAAAEPTGDAALVWRAAERIGLRADAVATASVHSLVDVEHGLRFRHPLARSAVYRSADPEDRRRAHRALAAVTDPVADADRRAWHLAHAASGPDEETASEVQRSADQARSRGGLAAAAALLEHAATLTPDRHVRATRALAAAESKYLAGDLRSATDLIAVAEETTLDKLQRARADRLRSRIAFDMSPGRSVSAALLGAAEQLLPEDDRLARDASMESLTAALFSGRLAGEGGLLEVARFIKDREMGSQGDGPSLLLDGLASLILTGYPGVGAHLAEALALFRPDDVPEDEQLSWLYLACHVAALTWDHESWDRLSAYCLERARRAGVLSVLPLALGTRAGVQIFSGEISDAASLLDETQRLTEALGSQIPPYVALLLAAARGREAEMTELLATANSAMAERGDGLGMSLAQTVSALMYNGLGRYESALAAATVAAGGPDVLWCPTWASVEMVEAATRTGDLERATSAMKRVAEATRSNDSNWGVGVERLSRALLSDGDHADRLFLESIDRLGRSTARLTLARAQLLYGEWLRRARRRTRARHYLRTAHEAFIFMGADAFVERAARELAATGEVAHSRSAGTVGVLTPRESQIAGLVRGGLTNTEIGRRLYLSPRTVEYHLAKIFTKLSITSRSQLGDVLASDQKDPSRDPAR